MALFDPYTLSVRQRLFNKTQGLEKPKILRLSPHEIQGYRLELKATAIKGYDHKLAKLKKPILYLLRGNFYHTDFDLHIMRLRNV